MINRNNIIKIGNKFIGPNQPVFIIAEAGVNHNGNFKIAKKLINEAARAGVDAIKFQTFNPDTLVTKIASKAQYQSKKAPKENQYEMLWGLILPREWHKKLKNYAEKRGLIFLSTPFSVDDANFLIKIGMPAIKVSSSDTNNIPYLQHISKKMVPIILSTGMSDIEEIKESVKTMQRSGAKNIIVLHCTTNYPTPFEEANLKAIQTLQQDLGLISGFSDHTLGIEAPIAAVAFGAKVIEKHFTLDKKMVGPDHQASLEPTELKEMVRSIRNIERSIGSGIKKPFQSELAIASSARKSVVAARFIPAGKKIVADDLALKRPGTGLRPKYYFEIIGALAKNNIKTDDLIKKSDYKK